MAFEIKCIEGEARFDCLPVIKLCCDEMVDINERVYAQAQLGRNNEEFFIRILSFEPKPAANARLSVRLCCNGGSFEAFATADEDFSALLNEENAAASLTAYLVRGEDLQGEYWGAVLSFPLDKLLKAFKAEKTALPLTLSGNVKRENPAVSAASTSGDATFVLK